MYLFVSKFIHLAVYTENNRALAVNLQEDGTYADKYGKVYPEDKVRKAYQVVIFIGDSSCEQRLKLTAYDKVAENLIGRSIDELYEMEQSEPLIYSRQIERLLKRKGCFGFRSVLRPFKGRMYVNHHLAYFD